VTKIRVVIRTHLSKWVIALADLIGRDGLHHRHARSARPEHAESHNMARNLSPTVLGAIGRYERDTSDREIIVRLLCL
jgi:hypothetical protein